MQRFSGILALFLCLPAWSAQKLTEVSTSTYGIIENGRVYYLDYYMPNAFTFYAAVHAFDVQSNTKEILIPQDGSTPYYIYYGVSGNHLPFIAMQSSTGGQGGMPKTMQGGFGSGAGAVYLDYFDIPKNSTRRLISDSSWKEMVWASGSYVTWVDYRHVNATDSANGEIYLYNFNDGSSRRITQTPWWESRPATDGHTLVWVSYENGTYGNVYYRDIDGGTPQAVSPGSYHQDKPRVNGRYIIWEDYRNASSDPSNADVYAYDLESQQVIAVCTEDGFQGNPYIDGSIVVWEDYRNESSGGINADIYGYDFSSEETFSVAVEQGYQGNPTVSNDSVLWLSMDADSTMWLSLETIDFTTLKGRQTACVPDRRAHLEVVLSSSELLVRRSDEVPRDIAVYDIRGKRIRPYPQSSPGATMRWAFHKRLAPGHYVVSIRLSEGQQTVNTLIGY